MGGVKCVPQTGGRLEVGSPVIPSSLLHEAFKYAKSNRQSHKEYFKTSAVAYLRSQKGEQSLGHGPVPVPPNL